jgi:YD repeat-containing protein
VMRNLIGIVFAMTLCAATAQGTSADLPDGVRRVVIEVEVDGGERRPLSESAYDEEGVLVERRSFAHAFATGALLRVTIERYGPDGTVLVREQYDGDGTVLGQTLVRTDAEGRVTERITYDGDGAVASRVVGIYDDAGRLVTSERYDGEVLVAIDQAAHDAEGRIVGSRSYDPEGDLLMEERRDAETGTTEMTAYRDGVPEVTSVQRFDALGAPTESIVTAPDGTMLSEVRQTYDDRGRLVEHVNRQRGDDGLTTTIDRFTYEDDAHGFWIVRRRLDADGAVVQTFYRSFWFEAP